MSEFMQAAVLFRIITIIIGLIIVYLGYLLFSEGISERLAEPIELDKKKPSLLFLAVPAIIFVVFGLAVVGYSIFFQGVKIEEQQDSYSNSPPSSNSESEMDASWQDEVNPSNRDYIRWVQSSLNKILELDLTVDGIVGPQTRNAIRSFQQRMRLVADGIPGPNTHREIQELVLRVKDKEVPKTDSSTRIMREKEKLVPILKKVVEQKQINEGERQVLKKWMLEVESKSESK